MGIWSLLFPDGAGEADPAAEPEPGATAGNTRGLPGSGGSSVRAKTHLCS